MSGPGDERWRGGRPYDPNRQSGQRQRNNNMGQQGSGRGSPAAGMGNTWGASRDAASMGLPQDQHVPVRGFNAAEAKAALRRGQGEPRPFFYKPSGKEVNNRASGPWGSKPNTTASGKDFFLELRKQITTLRQESNVPGG
ncbi:hypothetical protein ASPZODRAFT_17809 [Penicilliopsis zonata CBS 506.65]|uniref:Uncharacterized protein n=1 Tax=Penicilliopsis zonata CBS 506.65 TaxID=1073090 RepID=A0A1L9SCF0_9EURO|nr:hypothetical protein ASPZODRAFT_17809 [Penicilliopsis zonata CBS 506.65]OJJ44895.1 hypothetical protein ASPZODRAFT_17809 [Penicilliopsis zonata CBS 506.65]